MTKLQAYLDEHRIPASAIEKESGIPRASFRKLRQGRDPRLSTMWRVLRAVRVAGSATARMEDLFDLEPPSEGSRS
jgi:predicted transcriptional regulator